MRHRNCATSDVIFARGPNIFQGCPELYFPSPVGMNKGPELYFPSPVVLSQPYYLFYYQSILISELTPNLG